TAEGHDARVGIGARLEREPVGPGARAEDRPRRLDLVAIRHSKAYGAVACVDAADLVTQPHLAAGRAYVLGEGPRHQPKVHDAGGRRVQRGDSARVRLDLTDLLSTHSPQLRNLVGLAAALELVEARQLLLAGRHDQLAAAPGLDAMLLAVVIHRAC